jgi:hypothetical protein
MDGAVKDGAAAAEPVVAVSTPATPADGAAADVGAAQPSKRKESRGSGGGRPGKRKKGLEPEEEEIEVVFEHGCVQS